jgi:hypothetical protein
MLEKETMITVQIKGGLGNQLFQYAAGKALALQHNTKLALDLSGINRKDDTIRLFDLDQLHVNYEAGNPQPNRGLIRKILDRVGPAPSRRVYKESHFHFDPHFFRAGPDVYLKGYWQSEKYFKNIEPVIRKEFTVRDEYIQHLKAQADRMKAENSVFIHIRRSDYLKKEVQDYHGAMDAGYYNRAIAYISEKVSPVKVYFFSDDIEWVKQHITIDYPYEVVTGKITKTAIEDFYLMTQCKHAIIANSSFSWWAAWLNNHPSKIVVAPKQWFINSQLNTKDIIPATWTSIP